jgi:hypothetical protein
MLAILLVLIYNKVCYGGYKEEGEDSCIGHPRKILSRSYGD